jgi:alpha-D-ribose 1-methylphosphonate 5-triphosphate synthase subunit PhnH
MTDQIEAPLAAGFPAPVDDAQQVFRAVMQAMARPGSIVALPIAFSGTPPLPPSLAAIALALADFETPLWLDDTLRARPEAARYLQFHTGARMTERPDLADFALIADPAHMPPLNAFSHGTLEYPDHSTTLVLAVDSLEGGASLKLSGPGIQTSASLAPSPVVPGLAGQLVANRARFPRGVDLIFAAPSTIAALPRSTVVTP